MQRHIGLFAALGLLGGMGAMTATGALAAGPAPMGSPAPAATAPATGAPAPATGTMAQPAPMAVHAAGKTAAMEAPRAQPEWKHETAVVQEALDSAGAYVAVDGIWGPQTTAAIRDYQKANGLAVTGRLDAPTRTLLDPIG